MNRKISQLLSVALLSGGTAIAGSAGAGEYRDLNGNGTMEKYENPELPLEQRVEDLLGRMSLEQKVHMVSGLGWSAEERPREIDKVPGAAGYTYAVESLGLPSIVLADGPAGLRIWPNRKGEDRSYYATAFPVETVLSSTWNVDLLQDVGRAMGTEVKEYGVDVLLAPGMNIHRNPLGGRNFEYYSEDPYLSGHMAAAMVEGVESLGVGATLKHYVANNQETNRILVDTVVSERALREIYLRGFQIAVDKARPWAIMSAYNQVNGEAASESELLLNRVLRQEWGFDGVVMTDWFAGFDPVAQMHAGNELLMPGTEDRTQRLLEAARGGELDESVLDRNVGYILAMVLKSPTFAGYDYSDAPDLEAHAQVARAAASEGVVLLKNESGALPLGDTVSRVAAFGTTSYDFLSGGTGSGDVNEAYTVSMVDALADSPYAVDEALQALYMPYIEREKAKLPEKKVFFELLPPIPEMAVDAEVLERAARHNDIALVTIGRSSGEFQDRTEAGDFYLTDAEQTLVDDVAGAFHEAGKQVVVILNIGNVVETASWRGKVDAILLPWQGGQEAGNAVVDVLSGKVNPSGKLPTTFPVSYDDVPSAPYFPGEDIPGGEVRSVANGLLEARPSRVKYGEGIFVGYRYYDTFGVDPAYAFGYGLSYTDFKYGDLVVGEAGEDGSVSVSVKVENGGEVAGKEVVQLYLSAPSGELPKPRQELRAFAKTGELAPGESQVLRFDLAAEDLASFHDERAAWIADAGTYRVRIGASSRDIRAEGAFKLEQAITVSSGLVDLSPTDDPDRLAP